MNSDGYKLILNHLTYGESVLNETKPKKQEEYKQMVFLFLNRKGKFLFEEDILKHYREGMTLEKLFEQEGHRFAQGANQKKNGKMQKTWYDLWASEEIKYGDDFFDYFFACKLRHISLLEIDDFLTFHLEYSFDNNAKMYSRFLVLVIRKYKGEIISENISETIKEWMTQNESSSELSGSPKETKVKGKLKREREDKITKLNQEQTALLIYCLKETKIILKDEYLNNKEAGQAFSVLTGYSAETLRQNLNKSEQTRISTKKNNEVVKKALKEVLSFIENEMEPEL
mgnify:CR=1 FL=1